LFPKKSLLIFKEEITMRLKKFPTPLAFKYPWRSYQKQVLDQLDSHLCDNKLHVVAPPGSGKTVLGLEVMIRLNQPTLILAPTLTVKNQWVDRFCSLFLQVDKVPDWISTRLTQPQFLTVSTYQGLHAAFNYLKEMSEGDEEIQVESATYTNIHAHEIISKLRAVGIKTLVVDEVHHLRKEWWKSLDLLNKELKPTVVGLTATPPYGASSFEWQRYMDLAGPVDEEIAVPTLVEVEDLCPHQDFIYYCTPLADEREKIGQHKANVYSFYTVFKSNPTFAQTLQQSAFFQQPLQHLDWIYENLTTYVACLVFLQSIEGKIPSVHKKILGLSEEELPALDLLWFEKMLHFFCFQGQDLLGDVSAYPAFRTEVVAELKQRGLLAYRQVQLVQDNKGDDVLLSSLSKLQSIVDIVDFEHSVLGDDLRLAILTDYIHKEYYSTVQAPPTILSKLGVLSIFETLRRQNSKEVTLAVLTGSVVLVPHSCIEALNTLTQNEDKTLTVVPLTYDPKYVALQITVQQRPQLVHWITQLVEQGYIQVLIGTKALLGEGWDVPALNTLVMASSIGAYISSNQMRGRAFRVNPKDPYKTAHIWHLACVDTYATDGGKDWEVIHRRFQTFVGISNAEDQAQTSISNGIERLHEMKRTRKMDDEDYVAQLNQQTLLLAKQRNSLKKRWLTAIQSGSHLTEGVKLSFSSPRAQRDIRRAKQFYTNKTIVSALLTVLFSAIFFVLYQVVGLGKGILLHGLSLWSFAYWIFQTVVLGLGFRFGRKGWKYYRMYRKFGDMRKDVQGIGEALCSTLCAFDLLTTSQDSLRVVTTLEFGGGVFCALEGGSLRESHVFASCMNEILSPIENPRYVLERQTLLSIQDSESDFHAVPECIGVNRKQVNYFAQQWTQKVGRNRIVYTRTPEGRKELLQARAFALVNQLAEPAVKQEHQWR